MSVPMPGEQDGDVRLEAHQQIERDGRGAEHRHHVLDARQYSLCPAGLTLVQADHARCSLSRHFSRKPVSSPFASVVFSLLSTSR